jgi:hypothetical protein
MKKYIIVLVVCLVLGEIFLLSQNIYTSSPGYTTKENWDEFQKTKPKCYGKSLLLNEEETWVDAPGRSLCVGFLKRK